MAKRNEFKIEVSCIKCGSQNVEANLWMNQGTGLLSFECRDCPNDPDLAYDDDDLNDSMNLDYKNSKSASVRKGIIYFNEDEQEEEQDEATEIPFGPAPCETCLPTMPDENGDIKCVVCGNLVTYQIGKR